MDIIRVLRILEYVGPRDLVETGMSQWAVQGTKVFGEQTIRSAVLGTYPEILFSGEVAPESESGPGPDLGPIPQWVLDDPLQPKPQKLTGCRACFGSGGKRHNPCSVCNGRGQVLKEG